MVKKIALLSLLFLTAALFAFADNDNQSNLSFKLTPGAVDGRSFMLW